MGQSLDILHKNLKALSRTEPELVARLKDAEPLALDWATTKQGSLAASFTKDGRKLQLASRYDPIAEAKKFVERINPGQHAAVVLLGFGLGYHIKQAFDLLGEAQSLLIVFEPDVSLLRAVLERIDHSAWLGQNNIILADDQMDRAGLLGRVEKFGAIMTLGTILLTHPAGRQLNLKAINQFGKSVSETLAFFRTNVATALVNSSRTISNLSLNVAYYAAGANTNELHNAATGKLAICVGAGPSLAKNVSLLTDPKIRSKVVLISAQTTLKPLLDRGIRPDFVTALDYHEISKRFYEGLPDLHQQPAVTLVAEPKANPAIVDNFPGPVRVTQNGFLSRLLGDKARPIVPIASGATVAHLSFYLAQHLGCDPIVFIGQDLGFSEGLYYCPGTAIHDVWAPELNTFNTLEMMEWRRIVRHRGNLQRQDDIYGQSIFTDEQMLTYLKQFEKDFANANELIIDATEGGLPKQHSTRMTLAEAIEQYAKTTITPMATPVGQFDITRLNDAITLLERRLRETEKIRQLSQKTLPLLKQMKKHQRHYEKANKFYDKIQKNRVQVEMMGETFELINELNTIGAFNRARSDRAIIHAGGDEYEHQAKQLDRDAENINWLIQTCDEAIRIFTQAVDRTRQFKKQTEAANLLAT